jgi:hypothetical protein
MYHKKAHWWSGSGIGPDCQSHTTKKKPWAQAWWFLPVFLVTQEAEIGKMELQGQTEQKVIETPHLSK